MRVLTLITGRVLGARPSVEPQGPLHDCCRHGSHREPAVPRVEQRSLASAWGALLYGGSCLLDPRAANLDVTTFRTPLEVVAEQSPASLGLQPSVTVASPLLPSLVPPSFPPPLSVALTAAV